MSESFDFVTREAPPVDVSQSFAAVRPLSVDVRSLNHKRLAKLRGMLRQGRYGACLLFDPYNQRWATGSRNMFLYFLRNATRYIYIPVEGPVICFDYPGTEHASMTVDTIDESRLAKLTWSAVQFQNAERTEAFGKEIAALIAEHVPGEKRIAVDRCSLSLARSFEAVELVPIECQEELVRLRMVKLPEEIACLKASMMATELAVHAVRDAVRPGITEQKLFGLMMGKLIEEGGDFIKTRLLSGGTRTNPWFNEASSYQVCAGDLVGLDTDAIGYNGYYADMSRTFHCGPGRPKGHQQSLYSMAYDQVHHNMDLIKPGVSFREIAEKAWQIPNKYVERRYPSIIHGVGMHGEAPIIVHGMDWDNFGMDGVIEPGMTLAVESYIGEQGGSEGVKLEQEMLVVENGVEVFSTYPFEEELLVRQN